MTTRTHALALARVVNRGGLEEVVVTAWDLFARSLAVMGAGVILLGEGGCMAHSSGNIDDSSGDDGGTVAPDAAPQKDAGSPSKDGGSAHDSGGPPPPPGDDGGGPPPPQGDAACAQKTSQSACIGCCQGNHKTGFNTIHTAANQCLCVSPGACKTECATEFCANKAESKGDPCDTCIGNAIQQSAACYQPINSACQADPDCTAYLTCAQPCQNLP
jgi:hypothetical protein